MIDEELENLPYVQGLKGEIRSLEAEVARTKAECDRWRDEAGRWFNRYTGMEIYRKLAVAEDTIVRLKDELAAASREIAKMQAELFQAESQKDPGNK